MPAFNPALTSTIAVGEFKALVSPGDAGIVSTVSVAIGRDAAQTPMLAVFNTTDQTATVQFSWLNVDADFVPGSPTITVPSNSVVGVQTISPFVRCNFATSPTVGSLIISR